MNIKLKNTFFGIVVLIGICGIFAYHNPGYAEENTPAEGTSSYYNDKMISAEKFDAVTKIMDAGVDKFQAQKGMFIIADAADSAIVASYTTDKTPAIDKELYEAGSVYKTFTVAMGLESGSITDEDLFDTSEPLEVGGKKITDPHGSHGMLSPQDVLVESSNIGATRIALKTGGKYQYDFLDKLGLLSEINAYGISSVAPRFPEKEKWINSEILIATISYGYGVADTPLHIISAYSAIVNGGKYHKPSFEKIDNKEGVDVISEENSLKMREYLRKVVTSGTAKKADSDKYVLMGKTGTSQKIDPQTGKYDEEQVVSSFVGNFEHDGTNYAILVMLDDPKASKETYGYKTAGWNAVPIAKEVIEEFIK